MIPVVTIDGPSGSGKGTVSQLVAKKLAWHFLDSGALYRSLALVAIEQNISPDRIQLLISLVNDLNVTFNFYDSDYKVFLNNRDISIAIRSEQCGVMASKISTIAEIRCALLKAQRDFRRLPGLVADGRDMGTVIFPDALVKIFLIADAKERAQRRFRQLQEKLINVSLDVVYQELVRRDERDATRKIAPLQPASDAHIIDTTQLTIVEVVDNIIGLLTKLESV